MRGLENRQGHSKPNRIERFSQRWAMELPANDAYEMDMWRTSLRESGYPRPVAAGAEVSTSMRAQQERTVSTFPSFMPDAAARIARDRADRT